MADQIVSDAVLHPHDEGIGEIQDGDEDWNSAGLQMLLGQAVQSGSYVRSDTELTFTGHDGTNDTVDVTRGVAYLALTGETVNVQSDRGGSSPPAYDSGLATDVMPAICVVVPTTQSGVQLQAGTSSQVWLAYATDGTVSGVSAGDVYLRSDDSGSVSAPPHPSVELGSANPDDASVDSLTARFGSPRFDAVESQSLSTDSASITNYGNYANLIVRKTGNSSYIVVDGEQSGAVLQSGSDLSSILQTAINNRNGEQTHIHFAPTREFGTYKFTATVEIDVSSFLVSGGGKNKSQLELADNADTDMFLLDRDQSAGESAAIGEFVGVKLFGNRSNNTAGNGVNVLEYPEVNFYRTEVRSFPDANVRFAPKVNWEWNELQNTWILDGGAAGIEITGTNGGALEELQISGGFIKGRAGAPGLRTNAGVIDLQINGVRLKGADVIDLDGNNRTTISGCHASRIDGSFTVRIGDTSNTNQTNIKDCIFHGGGVTNHILLASNAFDFQIEGNRMFGQSGDAIAGPGLVIGASSVISHNPGFTTENNGTATILSGSTSVDNVSHGLDVTPNREDFTVTFAEDPGSAKGIWVQGVTASGFDIVVDADPGKNLDIDWRVVAYP